MPWVGHDVPTEGSPDWDMEGEPEKWEMGFHLLGPDLFCNLVTGH